MCLFPQDSFAHYGLVWFTLTDFVPFCIGGATFMLIMVTGGAKKRADSDSDEDYPTGDTDMLSQKLLGRGGDIIASREGDFQYLSDHDHNPLQNSRRSEFFKTPKHKQSNIVDSDIDDTPQTPDDDNTSPHHRQGDEENNNKRRACSSYDDANSSVTTTSPYGLRRDNEAFSPRTPHQRWMSFNSSSMLPSSPPADIQSSAIC
jgi:hypothetical protein